jgi:hypothetical protein
MKNSQPELAFAVTILSACRYGCFHGRLQAGWED